MYEDIGDGDLLLISREEPDAFGVLYERHAEGLLRYFARRTFDPEAAAELVGETFAEAFASRRRFRDQGGGAAGGAYGVARDPPGGGFPPRAGGPPAPR